MMLTMVGDPFARDGPRGEPQPGPEEMAGERVQVQGVVRLISNQSAILSGRRRSNSCLTTS